MIDMGRVLFATTVKIFNIWSPIDDCSEPGQSKFCLVLSWLIPHGFEPNNREWIGLLFLAILLIAALVSINRKQIKSIAWAVSTPPIVYILVGYAVWIGAFGFIIIYADIWRPILTKDTLVWGVTAGLALLFSVNKVGEGGYYRQTVQSVAGLLVLFEYVVNMHTFSIWVELVLQTVILFSLILPYGADDPEQRDHYRSHANSVLAVIGVGIVAYTIWAVLSQWNAINWEFFLIKLIWPAILGLWALLFVFPLARYVKYEHSHGSA
jgi:hypothetical protein